MTASSGIVQTRATGTYDLRDKLTGVRGYYTLLNDIESYEGESVFVCLCDVDNFRLINDAYGENVGNILLSEIGNVLKQIFGDEHTFRYGSDEFLIVGTFCDSNEFIEKLNDANGLISAIEIDSKRLNLTCSYGYTYGSMHTDEDMHEAIRFADRKMYESKRLGKARYVGAPLDVDPRFSSHHEFVSKYKSYDMDELTGLANLICIHRIIGKMLRMPELVDNEEDKLAVIYFNIENFKSYNQHFSFDAGDSLLMLIADAIRDAFPGRDAARLSADQFIVITTESKAIDGIEAVRAEFRKRQKDSSIWLKAGIYCINHGDDNAGVVCDRAKLACDEIRGRRDLHFYRYDASLQNHLARRRYVLDHFSEAIENGWITPFYQPIVRVATGEACDVEALARWNDPVNGLVSPAEFIPVLEESRLIHRLDLEIFKSVCRDIKQLVDSGRSPIAPSVNLSRLDFELCDIVAEVAKIADEYEIPHDFISVEVTESTLSGNAEFLRKEVDRFREAGFDVWMDDFGSGYSSLNVLKEYKFDLVKIDMGFLRDFDHVEESRVMLAHIVNLSKDLKLKTLVEGVETKEQYDFLRSIGVGRAQGYYLGKPMSFENTLANVNDMQYPKLENVSKRDFYEAIGRVNLLRPNPHAPVTEHYLPSDYAVAIIRRRAGRYEYLNTSDLYVQFLEDSGIGSLLESEKAINDTATERNREFLRTIDACESNNDWNVYHLVIDGITRYVHMRLISSMAEFDAIAVLAIADDSASL